jgi:hypothetical protein
MMIGAWREEPGDFCTTGELAIIGGILVIVWTIMYKLIAGAAGTPPAPSPSIPVAVLPEQEFKEEPVVHQLVQQDDGWQIVQSSEIDGARHHQLAEPLLTATSMPKCATKACHGGTSTATL